MGSKLLNLAALLLCLQNCHAAAMEEPVPPGATVAEIMEDTVMPAAEVLWDATAVWITREGEVDHTPQNDEEWQKVDRSRIAMEAAVAALLVPGRRVEEPGAAVEYPEEELTPEEIEAGIGREPAVWVAMVHALEATIKQAGQAIADQDVDALTEIGAAIDQACEACHRHFWYPDTATP